MKHLQTSETVCTGILFLPHIIARDLLIPEVFGCLAVPALLSSITWSYQIKQKETQAHTLSAHNLCHMLGAGNRDAFGHVDALFPGLLVVVQGVLVVVQAEQGELIQGDLQGSLVVQCISLDAAVCEERAGHLGDFAAVAGSDKRQKRKEGKEGVIWGEKKERGRRRRRGEAPDPVFRDNWSVQIDQCGWGGRKTVQGATKENIHPLCFPVESGCPSRCTEGRRPNSVFIPEPAVGREIIFLPDKEPLPGWLPSASLLLLSECLQSQTERCAGDVTAWAGTMRCCEAICISASWLAGRLAIGRGHTQSPARFFVVRCLCLSLPDCSPFKMFNIQYVLPHAEVTTMDINSIILLSVSQSAYLWDTPSETIVWCCSKTFWIILQGFFPLYKTNPTITFEKKDRFFMFLLCCCDVVCQRAFTGL